MNPDHLKNIIEAALMAVNEPISINQLLVLFEKENDKPDKNEIRTALGKLQEEYENRGIELKQVASGFRFQVRSDCAKWVNQLFDEKPQRYSRALLETLAIIAYRQPVTRAEIENIRGVSVSTTIVKTLIEREWVRVVGHRDVPGRPELLATTKQFLDYFNLKKLSELPPLSEIKDFDQINPDLFQDELNVQPITTAESMTGHHETQDADQESLDDELTTEDEDTANIEADNVIPFSH